MTEVVTQLERELSIPSEGERLAQMRGFIAKLARTCGFNEPGVFDIQVAVGEAVANAIEHGSPLGAKNHVEISCRANDDGLEIKVVDQGVFRKAVPHPDPKLSYRGHGILLMLALMDKVTIDESPQGTSVTLIKRH